MKAIGAVDGNNRDLFNDCVNLGNKLIGHSPAQKITPKTERPIKTSDFDFSLFLSGLQALSKVDTPQKRGYAFEKYLNELFKASNLDPRGAFKLEGEQIDGSFILRDNVYLSEAKWQNAPVDNADLVIFNHKVSS
jgi:hypothetical protein